MYVSRFQTITQELRKEVATSYVSQGKAKTTTRALWKHQPHPALVRDLTRALHRETSIQFELWSGPKESWEYSAPQNTSHSQPVKEDSP